MHRTLFTALGIAVLVASTASNSFAADAFKPVAPVEEVGRVLTESVTALEEQTKTEPERRRGWIKVAHQAWMVAEMSNLLTLQQDADGNLAKHAAASRDAALALAKTARLRKYDPVPGQVKSIKEAYDNITKALKAGGLKPVAKADFEGVAPVIEVMEMNQEHFDMLLRLSEVKPSDDDAYGDVAHGGWMLSETGNLMTLQNTDKADWQKFAGEMRSLGGRLAEAAGKKDFAAIQKLVKAIDTNCLDCHDQYQ